MAAAAAPPSLSGDACEKFHCVAEREQKSTATCPQLIVPKCSSDQTNKMINDTNGCSKFICGEMLSLFSVLKFVLRISLDIPLDCVPKSQCKPVENSTMSLDAAWKFVIDTSGCCPTRKMTCDKFSCPSKLTECKEAFHQVERTKKASEKICCDEYECRKLI